ncbi:MAG: translation initiation factor IF-3 [Deltaproteobacteria bacterium]|nr:translation initiation factor IF-3 [Candidatus Anaeroferrophillus wilburensis]MBN2889719.1 translation initiation factor IF-3 [Deltaproteobacteria bacterium]
MPIATERTRVNRQIKVGSVRLIDDNSSQLGIVTIDEALDIASERGLDLVEVSPNADPPVCKIMDYGKFKYQQSKKAQEAKKKQTTIQVKEVKMRPRTDSHDFNFKIKHVIRFLEEGDKAKITIRFRGREMAYTDQGIELLGRVVEAVKEHGVVEQQVQREGRQLSLVLAPVKKKRQP